MLPPLPFLPPILPPILPRSLPLLPPTHGRQTRQTGLNSGRERRTLPTHNQKAAKTAMFTTPVNIAAARGWRLPHPQPPQVRVGARHASPAGPPVKGARLRASYPRTAAGTLAPPSPAAGPAWYAYARPRGSPDTDPSPFTRPRPCATTARRTDEPQSVSAPHRRAATPL